MTIFLILLLTLLATGAIFFIFNLFLDTKKKHAWFNAMESKVLLIEIPRTNDKKELSAEHMFASLHGILKNKRELKAHQEYQEHIGFEIVSIGNKIQFYIWTPAMLTSFVEGQVYAQYPEAQIKQIDPEDDYVHQIPEGHYRQVVEIGLTENETLPIKTFLSFEVDPLAAITATLTKLEAENEMLGIQILARPVDDTWHKNSAKKAELIKNGGGSSISRHGWLAQTTGALWKPPEETTTATKSEISERDKTRITAIEEKSRKLGYQVKIRVIYSSPPEVQLSSRMKIQALLGAFKQFNTTNLNGFKQTTSKLEDFDKYKARSFFDKGFILNIEELASVYHLPHSNVATPGIVWARARTGEPPSNLPIYTPGSVDISPIGVTTFRGDYQYFGLTRRDRGRHVYIIGQTGVGKSGLLELMTSADITTNQGFALIDPHGDFAINTLQRIAPERIKDVIYFNPADTEFPIGFNPLEVQNESQKTLVASEIIGSLKKMFDSWGPRLEYILRYTILSLLEYPNTTMLDITRLLTDNKFQKEVVSRVTDPVVRNFWDKEYASWNEKFRTEAVAPILNKVGAFTANPIIRNIVGQPTSGFNVRQVMDEGKILVMNLSRGLIGEDNAAILGSLLVTKVQLAAMSRADIAKVEDRRPFYFYVDEFQNFATESFATILSEARKYGLNLTIANQYISQMIPEVSGAVFGNVGSIISFRVSPEDATSLQKYFEPQFEAADLIQLNNRDFLANLSIGGEKTVPFSARTMDLPGYIEGSIAQIIVHNRQLFAHPKAEIEALIRGTKEHPTSSQQKSTPTTPRVFDRNTATQKLARSALGVEQLTHAVPEQTESVGAINTKSSDQAPIESTKKKKTRRGKRGGKKKAQAQPPEGPPTAPNSNNSEETVYLRK
ncbi:MAG: type IV secretion system DNA-binding domain-containing protein [Candidatus Saccharimonadales bacterium]